MPITMAHYAMGDRYCRLTKEAMLKYRTEVSLPDLFFLKVNKLLLAILMAPVGSLTCD